MKNEYHLAASNADSANDSCGAGDSGTLNAAASMALVAPSAVIQSQGGDDDSSPPAPAANTSASSDDSDDFSATSATTPRTTHAVALPSGTPIAAAAPTVTDALGADGVTVSGTADPNAGVTIASGLHTVGTAQADASGAWSFDTATLAPGPYTLVASETDAAGNTGSAAPLAVTVPARFNVMDVVTANQTLLHGSDYPGPVNYLQAGYNYTGTDNSVISALVGSVFMHAGTSGENAEVALSGNNVLASGSSSSWLVGASGADGGNDTFFLSDRGTQQTWDTLVNFHVGDMLTLWDFNSATGSTTSLGLQGADKAQGETVAVNFGNGSNSSTLVTFAGLPASARFSTTTGSTGGHDFLMMTRTV